MAKGPSTQEVMSYLQTLGFNRIQAAGITGNLHVESGGFDINVIEGRRRGDSGTAVGLMQWRHSRHENLLRFARQMGKNPYHWQTQLMFLKAEMLPGAYHDKGSGLALRQLQSAKTPMQAAAAFVHAERPAGYNAADPTKSMHFRQRAQQADLAAGGSGEVNTSTGNQSYGDSYDSGFGNEFMTEGDFGAETHQEAMNFGTFRRPQQGWNGQNPLGYSDFEMSSPYNLNGDYSNLNNLYSYDTNPRSSKQMFGIEGVS